MATSCLNFNIGVLGHIDSGKTSLSKALSTTASTAAFDKNPQSRQRGITIDLGFSSFCVPCPEHLKEKSTNKNIEFLQFTLVDCPGHASLIRTIIGGAQIIDLMLLVVDITKGIQTQTAECLVIGEISCDKMIVVLNKIDLVPDDKKQEKIDKITKRLKKTLETTKFANAAIIPVSAKPGGTEGKDSNLPGIQTLIDGLCQHAYVPSRNPEGSFIFLADHCFSIKGQGTVMTGTVIQGSVHINDVIEIPSLKLSKKVKSIQVFRKSIETAIQGDRVGICVTQFDPKQLERGYVSSPGFMDLVYAAIAVVKKIPYYKASCGTKKKFHISIMHDTVMAKCSFFGLLSGVKENKTEATKEQSTEKEFIFDEEYVYQEELLSESCKEDNITLPSSQYALLEFEKPIILSKGSLFIGSRLDSDIHANVCRLAFHGNILQTFTSKNYAETHLPNLKVYKTKLKEGLVERMVNDQEVIGRSLFKKETNIESFIGFKVNLSTGENGMIDGGFGQSGKVKIRTLEGLKESTKALLVTAGKKKGKSVEQQPEDSYNKQVKIILKFKRYVYDPKKKMIQAS